MLGYIKKRFFTEITFFSYNALNVNSLGCASINNQECKTRAKIININNFILLVLKQINAVEVVIISMIHMLNCVFQMLLKT